MSGSFVVAADLGAGGCKTLIANERGEAVASAQAEYPTAYPHLGWCEQDPQDWLDAVGETVRRALSQADLSPSQIVAFVIDVEGSLLFDPVANEWVDEFVEDLGLPVSVLPEVIKPTEVISRISEQGADCAGLPVGTPVITAPTDTVAETFGAGTLRPGQGTVKLASVGRIVCVTSSPSDHPNLLNYRHVMEGLWYPGTACKYATSAFRWLRETMWCDTPYAEMSAAGASVPAGGNGVLFHPHLLGEWVPYWDIGLRGDFLGLTARHGRPHFTRARWKGWLSRCVLV